MSGNITFAMIKPSAYAQNYAGPILSMICLAGFRIQAITSALLTREQAEAFYAVHLGKPFFHDLVEFMSSGPIIAMVLQKENAVDDFRKLIGSTDPAKAEEGTIRKLYAKSVQENAVHGSDSDENARIEADFFFSKRERFQW
jgi:nucleoside-diphosphate kinase